MVNIFHYFPRIITNPLHFYIINTLFCTESLDKVWIYKYPHIIKHRIIRNVQMECSKTTALVVFLIGISKIPCMPRMYISFLRIQSNFVNLVEIVIIKCAIYEMLKLATVCINNTLAFCTPSFLGH